MAAITPPTVLEEVKDNLPFIDGATQDSTINNYTYGIMQELKSPFGGVDPFDDPDDLTGAQRTLVADLVTIRMITRRGLINTEGEGGSAATGNRIVTKGKAGEVEAEFEVLKSKDGARLLQTMDGMLQGFMESAMRKARSLGFILDFAKESEFTIHAMGKGILKTPFIVKEF